MSEKVKIPFGGEASDRAVLLLAAAEELGQDAAVVQATDGAFLVPSEVADKSGIDYENGSESSEKPDPPAKKTAAKKATAKKAATKRAASKKE